VACVSPLDGWFSKDLTALGKRSVVFDLSLALANKPVTVPCGQCIGCRLEYSRNWAMRCMHEASMHEENCFVTLTYDDDHLPENGSLVKEDAQKFMKRLRSRFDECRIRYFLSGEYGETTFRPHYHMLLFGFDFADKVSAGSRSEYKVWNSDKLEQTWTDGFSEVGSITFESAAYVARYIVKKFKGPSEVVKKWYDGVQPEFALMSRRPGIGKSYYEKYGKEISRFDSVIINGKEVKPPRYYDTLFEAVSPLGSICSKAKRKEKYLAGRRKDGRGDSKLLAEKELMEARISLYGGEL